MKNIIFLAFLLIAGLTFGQGNTDLGTSTTNLDYKGFRNTPKAQGVVLVKANGAVVDLSIELDSLIKLLTPSTSAINPQDSLGKYFNYGDSILVYSPAWRYLHYKIGDKRSSAFATVDSFKVEVLRQGTWESVYVKDCSTGGNVNILVPGNGNWAVYDLYPNMLYVKLLRLRRINAASTQTGIPVMLISVVSG